MSGTGAPPPLALPEGIVFDERGLVPVVVQDRRGGDVLMVAWADAEALSRTVQTGLAHFWSRSRQAPWQKGETSGNRLRVHELRRDCDGDTLLLLADAEGPACHTGMRTCFGESSPTAAGVLEELRSVIAERARVRPEHSYTARLFEKGLDHILKKVGEEATEVVIAAKGDDDRRVTEEGADLVFHLLVVLEQRGIPVADVLDVLRERRRGG